MAFKSKARAALARALKRFARARRGAVAVEFAIVALPFFFLSMGMLETAMVGLAQSSLDFAISETARDIRTGQAQNLNLSYQQMKDRLCAEMGGIIQVDCVENLYLDVDTFASFVAAGSPNPIVNGTLQTGQFGYDPGVSSSIVVVRAYYRWEILTPMFQPLLENVSGGDRILASTMMFRNEPY